MPTRGCIPVRIPLLLLAFLLSLAAGHGFPEKHRAEPPPPPHGFPEKHRAEPPPPPPPPHRAEQPPPPPSRLPARPSPPGRNARMDPWEAEALFEVMESMSGDAPWRKAHPRPCAGGTWPGLECKRGSDNLLHVSRLDFGYKPNPSCRKNATFPPSLFKLAHLEGIFMFQCFTRTFTTIPEGLERLAPSLQQLSLRANRALVGGIPRGIAGLGALQVLTLSQNSLRGDIPPELGRLSALLHLDLSYNSFHGSIPAGVGSLRSLLGLDLSYNSLRGPIPASLGNLRSLQKLDLSSNSLAGRIPASLGNLRSLEFVALSNNKLSGGLPAPLGGLQSLQYFIMDNNPMRSPLPALFGTLRRLQELRLANSGYSGSIPAAYGGLWNLSTLSLENNRISGTIPPSIGKLNHIYHLNLSGNALSGPVPFSADYLRRLGRNVDLRGNLGLCFNDSQSKETLQLGLGVCGALPVRTRSGRKSKKSRGTSLRGRHCRSFIHVLGSFVVYALMACK